MSESTPASSDLESCPSVTHVDASFAPLIPKFMANRKKEITTMAEAVTQGDFETIRKVAHGMKGVSGCSGFPAWRGGGAGRSPPAWVADGESISRGLTTLASYLDRVEIVYEES